MLRRSAILGYVNELDQFFGKRLTAGRRE